MKTLKTGKMSVVLITLLLASTMLSVPTKAHAAGSPQDAVMDMAKDAVKSWAGDKLEAFLFPKEGVDYDRIKKDMEQVTRKAITDAEIDKVLGEIGGVSQIARTAMYDSDPVGELNKVRSTLVMSIAKITQGQFQVPGIGNYILGAQTETSILTAMLEKAPPSSSSNSCDRACILRTMSDRLDSHTDHLRATVKTIVDNALVGSIATVGGCYMDYDVIDIMGRPHKIDLGYMFTDSSRGYRSPHYGKDSRATCVDVRDTYMRTKKQEAYKQVSNGVTWMFNVRANWTQGQILAKPAQKETIIRTAMADTLPFILADQSACYSQIAIALKGNPTMEACTVFKALTERQQTCPSPAADYKVLGETLGCNY